MAEGKTRVVVTGRAMRGPWYKGAVGELISTDRGFTYDCHVRLDDGMEHWFMGFDVTVITSLQERVMRYARFRTASPDAEVEAAWAEVEAALSQKVAP